jgi:hypothetical protein
VNRAQRRSQGVRLRRMLQSNPWWIDHLRRYPQVSLDAPEIPGRKYRLCTHHVYGCASYRDGDFDAAGVRLRRLHHEASRADAARRRVLVLSLREPGFVKREVEDERARSAEAVRAVAAIFSRL